MLFNEIIPRVRRVDDPTTSRHRATTSGTKNEKRTQGICTMGATTVRDCPLWWQPHDNGDILRSPPTQNFNPARTCTTQVSTYTLDQQEEMATVFVVWRKRQSARNTNACSPRHTLLSASTRCWLSMSAHQNHDAPPRHGVLSGENRRHAVTDMEVFVVKGTESESSLPESLAQCHGKR